MSGFDPDAASPPDPADAAPVPERREYPTRASLRGRPPASERKKRAPATGAITTTDRPAPQTQPRGVTGPVPPVDGPPVGPLVDGLPADGQLAGGQPVAGAPAAGTPAAGVPAAGTGEPAEEPSPGASPSPIPKAVAGLVALIGVLLIAGGILQSTVFKAPSTISASLAQAPSQPIVVSSVGMLGLDGPRVDITASSAAGKPVFLGIGRASDVEAYLAKVKRLNVTGEDGQGTLTSTSAGSEASLPNPGAADVWVLSQRGQGSAALSWPTVSGQYVVVSATDGTAPAPTRLTLTWSGAKPQSSGAALIAIGAVFLVCGLVLLAMLISRARLERSA